MPARSCKVPSFGLHKATGQAVAYFNRRPVYLGRHDSPEARENYNRVLAEWLAGGCETPA